MTSIILFDIYGLSSKEAVYSLSTLQSMPSLVNLVPFQRNKEEGRPTMDKRKLDSAVNESLAD